MAWLTQNEIQNFQRTIRVASCEVPIAMYVQPRDEV